MLQRLELLQAAEQLHAQSFAVINAYDDRQSSELQEKLSYLIETYGFDLLSQFSYAIEERPDGSFEPDDGFLDVGGNKSVNAYGHEKDRKRIFHFRPALSLLIPGQLHSSFDYGERFRADLIEFLRLSEKVYLHHQSIARRLTQAFDSLGVVPCSFEREIDKALRDPIATSRSVLRLLDYPPYENEVKAKVHFDKSCLTLHAGDIGGELFARLPNGEERAISPRKGQMIVFWGVKARVLVSKHGHVLSPLAHGVRGKPNEVRKAVVSFWHTNEVLWDAPKVMF